MVFQGIKVENQSIFSEKSNATTLENFHFNDLRFGGTTTNYSKILSYKIKA